MPKFSSNCSINFLMELKYLTINTNTTTTNNNHNNRVIWIFCCLLNRCSLASQCIDRAEDYSLINSSAFPNFEWLVLYFRSKTQHREYGKRVLGSNCGNNGRNIFFSLLLARHATSNLTMYFSLHSVFFCSPKIFPFNSSLGSYHCFCIV